MKRESQLPTADPKPHPPRSTVGENDRFSNANLLSMLARSQSSRSQSRLGNTGTSSSASRTATGQISTGSKDSSRRRRDEKESVRESASVVSQRSSTGSNRRTRELCEKISNSVSSYVSTTFTPTISESYLSGNVCPFCHSAIGNRDRSWWFCHCISRLQCGNWRFRGRQEVPFDCHR